MIVLATLYLGQKMAVAWVRHSRETVLGAEILDNFRGEANKTLKS